MFIGQTNLWNMCYQTVIPSSLVNSERESWRSLISAKLSMNTMLDPGKSVSHLPLAILQVRGRVTTPKQPKLFNIMLGQALVARLAPKEKYLFTPKFITKKCMQLLVSGMQLSLVNYSNFILILISTLINI